MLAETIGIKGEKNVKPIPLSPLESRLGALEATVEELEAEVEVLRAQNRLVIRRTNVTFLDQFYLKGGLALLLPRAQSFPSRVDTGLGAYVGVGKYYRRHHVVDASLDWDFYPALSLRYRFEFHLESPLVNVGPMIGYKFRLLDIRPIDSFMDVPGETKSAFYLVGVHVGFPISRSVVTFEALYLFNGQSVLVANAGLQFFL